MKNINYFGIIIACTSLLTACGSTDQQYNPKIISPVGAPTLAFYEQSATSQFDTNSTPSNVLAQLQGNSYDMVVFDSINALRSIKKNNSDFKLLRILTGGNFFLVGIDKSSADVPTSDDVILSFGQNLVPDVVYNYLFETAPVDYYVPAVSDAAAALKAGTYQGNKLDYVFIAQPALYAAMNDSAAETYGRVQIISNIRQEFEEKTGQKAIPQAGLFVRYKEGYEKQLDYYKNFLALIDDQIDTAMNDVDMVVRKLNESFESLAAQASKLGYNSTIVNALQKDGLNMFGLVSAEDEATIDINEFLDTINQSPIDDSLIIKK